MPAPFYRHAALIVCAFALLLSGCGLPTVAAIRFTEAEYWQQIPSIVEVRPAPKRYEIPPQAQWTRVALPHVVPRPIVNTAGLSNVVWGTRWYRFQWQVANDRGHVQVLYIPRVHIPADIDVYVDGEHIASNPRAGWNDPLLFRIPPDRSPSAASAGAQERPPDRSPSAARTREVLIGLSQEPNYGTALSTVWLGPELELTTRWEARDFFQRSVPRGGGLAVLALGLLAIAFWSRRRAERSYLLFGLIAPVYFLRTLHFYIDTYASWYEWQWLYIWVTLNSLGWLQVVVYFFAAELHGQRFPRVERAILGVTIAVSIISLIINLTFDWYWNLLPAFYLVQFFVSVVAITFTTIGAFRGSSATAKVLAVMFWLFLLMGMHDWLLQSWYVDVESIYLMPYGGLLVVAAALLAIFQRYLGAIDETDRLNASLERRLAERSRELEESHRKLRFIEQEQAVAGERQRLMREMHDGLGSSLMSSLVMVERGALDHSQVAQVLRESLDDLKLTIDSLEPMGEDLLTLLGTLRYRLGKRLEAAGVRLEWGVAETPPLPWLNPTSSLQILRILQEGLTNTLKHARATHIRVETAFDERTVTIRLVDNGIGFDVDATRAAPTGRGLQNLERRAATLSGTIQLRSQAGETVLELHLPRERRAQPR
jgi:signal transduction histidine kinase